MFTNLPMPEIDATIREIAYGIDTLGADGVAFFTNYDGRYLGDPAYLPVFEEINRREAVVFVHPISPRNANKIFGISESTLDYPLETTRAIVSLLYAGVPELFPQIRFIFTHGGGAVPYLAGRIATFSELNPDFRQRGFSRVIPALQRFYYDITQSVNPYTFAALRTLVSDNQLLFGSDIPFARQQQIDFTLSELPTIGLSESALANVKSANAMRLFPGLAARSHRS